MIIPRDFVGFPRNLVDVDALITQELFMFSSDYPHIEGGRNPLKRFEDSLAGINDDARESFYATNFAEMMGSTT